MSEPTRPSTLTLRTSLNTVVREGATAARAARRVATQEQSGDVANERTLSSDHLLQGRSHVFIAHNGERYQLRATRLGKLILTK